MLTESYEKAGASQGTCPPWPRLVQIPEDSFARPNLHHPQQRWPGAPTQQSGQSWARTSSPLPGLRPPVSWTQISPSANKTRHTCVTKCQRRVLGEADSAFRCPNADGVCRPLSSFCLTCAQGGAENRVLPPRCRWGRSDRQLLASPWPCWTPVTPEAPFFVGRAREARGSPDPGAVFRWSRLWMRVRRQRRGAEDAWEGDRGPGGKPESAAGVAAVLRHLRPCPRPPQLRLPPAFPACRQLQVSDDTLLPVPV